MFRKVLLAAAAVLGLGTVLPLTAAPSAALAADVIKTATMRGRGGHSSSGDIQIVNDGGVMKVVFAKNFRLEGAPDPKLAWGNDGYKRGTIFAKLVKQRGAQEYVIPAGTDLGKYNEFWLWCEKFNAPLAVGRLK